MALDLKAACGSVVRPDIAPRTITIRAGVHTGLTNSEYFFFVSDDIISVDFEDIL